MLFFLSFVSLKEQRNQHISKHLNDIIDVVHDTSSLLDFFQNDKQSCVRAFQSSFGLILSRYSIRRSSRTDCAHLTSGQIPCLEKPEVSFVILNNDRCSSFKTGRLLIQLFKTSKEAKSVEYIIVGGTCGKSNIYLERIVRLLIKYFACKIHIIRNIKDENHSNLRNRGVERASGKYIVIFDHDVYPLQGWYTGLRQVFLDHEKIGIVGPLFIDANMRVIEAGGIVFQDGSIAKYGSSANISSALYYSRPVDYISAACIMFLKDTFTAIRGFDQKVYGIQSLYRDADFSMSVWLINMSVLYQPRAILIHDKSISKSAPIDINQEYFQNKWENALQTHCTPSTPLKLAATRRRPRSVLWIDESAPEPDRDSGSVRTLSIFKILISLGYQITLHLLSGSQRKYYLSALSLGVIISQPVKRRRSIPIFQKEGCSFDIIVIARVTSYVDVEFDVRNFCHHVPIIFDTVDLHFIREARVAQNRLQLHNMSWEFLSMSQIAKTIKRKTRMRMVTELGLVRRSTATIVVSKIERDLLVSYLPQANIHIVSMVYDVDDNYMFSRDCGSREGTLFVGNMHHVPNILGLSTFISDVAPHLERRYLLQTHIVGSGMLPGRLLEAFQNLGVQVHGHLTDSELAALYGTVKVVIAPLFSGAGVKGKITQALRFGVPIICTPIAAEGMGLQHNLNVLIADSPTLFAEHIRTAHNNCSMWNSLSMKGKAHVLNFFSTQIARRNLVELLKTVGESPDLPHSPSCVFPTSI